MESPEDCLHTEMVYESSRLVGANHGLSWTNLGYLNTDLCLSTPRSSLRLGWVHRTHTLVGSQALDLVYAADLRAML